MIRLRNNRFTSIRQNTHKLLERLERFPELEIQIGLESLVNIYNASVPFPFIAPRYTYQIF